MQQSIDPNEPRHRFWFGLAPCDWLLVLFSWPYMTGIFSLVGHELFAEPGHIRATVIASAVFLSMYLVIIETRVVVVPSHWVNGRRFLELGGLVLKENVGDRWKIISAIVFRLVMACVISVVTAICVSSIIFRADIDAFYAREAAQQNMHLADGVGGRIDAETSDKRTALADAMKRDRLLSDQVGKLRGKVTTGRARQELATQLPGLEGQLAAEDAIVAKLRTEIDDLVAGRAAAVNRDVETSPGYARVPHGILADVSALESLGNADPHARYVMSAIEAFALLLEVALVLATATDFVPSAASGAWVFQLYTFARKLAKKAAEEENAVEIERSPFDDVAPPVNDNGAPAAMEPNFGTLTSGLPDGFDGPPTPPRRPRGRPRKDSYN